MDICIRELTYASANGENRIFARVVEPTENVDVRGVLQISHGMAEHGQRYLDFARSAAELGFAVCINDHAGHGRSVKDGGDYGYFGKGGYHSLVEDLHSLRKILQGDYPEVPYILMGHSMGSFLARSYLAKYGKGLAGCILMGTSAGPGTAAVGAGLLLADAVVRSKGAKAHVGLLKNITPGGYNRRFVPARTENDWLSRDTAEVDRYNEDPLCGFSFTASGYRELIRLLGDVNRPEWFGRVPDIPILLVSGDQDPVGDFGKGVRKVASRLCKAGRRVQLVLYPGARHEVLNETNRKEVYRDLFDFMLSLLPEGESVG